MFVNLERDVCTGAGGFHIYTETSLVGCTPKGCGRQRGRQLKGLEYDSQWDQNKRTDCASWPVGVSLM